MQTLEAKFQIVTPMFMGDANQSADDGVRPPSVKGALRFWWRALNWGRFQSQSSCDEAALVLLHDEESRLFGNAANDGTGGQGCFLLSVRQNPIQSSQPDINTPGKKYLAGPGLGRNPRPALPEEEYFSISLRFSPQTLSTDKDSLAEVIRFLGVFGGLGGRSRRGYGSISAVVTADENERLLTETELAEECTWLKSILCSYSTTASPFSALDSSTLFYRGADHTTWQGAMDKVGNMMNRYRTNGTSLIRYPGGATIAASPGCRLIGNSDIPNNLTNFPFFSTDHNQVYAIASSKTITSPRNVPPERAVFGIPHPYRFSSLGPTTVNFDFIPSWSTGNNKGRRASPLFIHIAAFVTANNQIRYRPLLLLLPTQFLPINSHLDVSVDGRNVGYVPPPVNYTPISDFLTKHFTAC